MTPGPIHQAAARTSLETASGLQAVKRHSADAYRDTVLLAELGMRAYRELQEPDAHRPETRITGPLAFGLEEPGHEVVCRACGLPWPCPDAPGQPAVFIPDNAEAPF